MKRLFFVLGIILLLAGCDTEPEPDVTVPSEFRGKWEVVTGDLPVGVSSAGYEIGRDYISVYRNGNRKKYDVSYKKDEFRSNSKINGATRDSQIRIINVVTSTTMNVTLESPFIEHCNKVSAFSW